MVELTGRFRVPNLLLVATAVKSLNRTNELGRAKFVRMT